MGGGAGELFLVRAPASEETKCVTVATVPCAYWLRQPQLNLKGLIIIGCARLRRSYIQIKNFLNSYRAGAHSNSVTHDVSALFSATLPLQCTVLISWLL